MRCSNCATDLEPGGKFCGGCGREVSPSHGQIEASHSHGNGAEPGEFQRGRAPRETISRGGFFSHAAGRPASFMTNATRYLCAAAYLSPRYAGAVTRDLVASHRAVAPSVGVDVGPVIRHCLKARSMQVTRDALITALLVVNLFVDPGTTVGVLLIAFLLGFLPSVDWSRKSLRVKIFAVAGSLFLIGDFIFVLILLGIAAFIHEIGTSLGASDQGLTGADQAASSSPRGLISVLLLIAIVVVQVSYTYLRSRTLCDELGPDAVRRPASRRSRSADARLARVEAAQYGNLVLYSGENPFIGTGPRSRAWSIAVELQRDNGGQRMLSPSQLRGYVPIDPVDLHRVIRERLDKLNDEDLPVNERLTAMTVHDHIVGLGLHRWDSPVMDQALCVPFSEASPEAVAALIRHPQAGLRYYQRVSICDEGQPVWAGQDKVIDGSDQDIAASAFVHIAVEGRMLYLEFVATVMPPVDPRWHVVDLLPKITAGQFWVKVIVDAFSTIFQDLIYSPFRCIRSLIYMSKENRGYKEEEAAAADSLYGDIGARVSVRELGAATKFGTYIQQLDAVKYTKLVERLINDTVLDYLAAKGVDTSAYANTAMTIMNNGGVIASGTFNGPAAFGAGATAQQFGQAQQGAKAQSSTV
jgi:hypothetical protein